MSRAVFRGGKVIARVDVLPGGDIRMSKSTAVKPEHVMRITGAPGWDKASVDAHFTRGVGGGLRFVMDDVQYDIPISTFREHAFEKEMEPYGVQYHVDIKHYKSTGLARVSPKKDDAVQLPKRLVFGQWLPCPKCKTGKKDCERCGGKGVVPWK